MLTLNTHVDEALFQRNLQLEEEGVEAGLVRYRTAMQEAKDNGLESTTRAGQRLMQAAIEPMEKAIIEWIESCIAKEGGGRRNSTAAVLMHLDPGVIAFITAKSVLDSISKQLTLNNTVIHIGGLIEDEMHLAEFKSMHPSYYTAIDKRIKKSPNYRYKRTVFNHAANKQGVQWSNWTNVFKVHVGEKCLDLFMASTGLVEVKIVNPERNNSIYHVIASPDTMHWINEENARCELLSPLYFPMLVEPKDWTSPTNGGYYSQKMQRTVKLLKAKSRAFLDELETREMPMVYDSINTMQKTPWMVNQRMLDVVKQVWDSHMDLGKLPPREDLPIPPSPVPSHIHKTMMNPEQLAAFRLWKHRAGKVYEINIQNRSKRIHASRIIYMAERFSTENRFYFPYNMDFRGRVYAIPNFLNPQGQDMAKGLLTFAAGIPIEDGKAAGWHAIHGANLYGYDKVGYDERIDWVADNIDEIKASAEDPINNHFWTKADKPWQFLAWCLEWSQFEEEGFGFVSHLPIALDGSCNGLQHYSAMLRDSVGGSAVNLIPGELPQDIYQRVADVTIEKLKAITPAESGNSDFYELAQEWLEFGIDRKMTKRPVMCLPYGLTAYSCREYIEQRYWETREESPERFLNGEPFNGNPFEATRFLSTIIWESIGEVVVAAREAMDWLQKVAKLAASQGLPINWTTPTGLPVQQPYRDMSSKVVKTHLSGKLVQLTIKEELKNVDKKRQAAAIAPNFVHSLDSSCLQMYVCKATKEFGINSFAMVHDSYATHAALTEQSSQCLREVFVDLYQTDPLQDLLNDLTPLLDESTVIKLPPIPPKGSLNLDDVKRSQFFFS